MALSLTKIAHLLAAAREKNFSRAARSLNISQPALSRTIASIEDYYGIRIFERGKGGVSITAVGREVLAEANLLETQAATLEHHLTLHRREDAGVINIGFAPAVATVALGEVVGQLHNERPHAKIRTFIRPAPELAEAILNETIDLALCPAYQMADPSKITMKSIGEFTVRFLARKQHPLADADLIRMSDIESHPMVTVNEVDLVTSNRRSGLILCDDFSLCKNMILSADVIWFSAVNAVKQEIANGQIIELPVVDYPVQTAIVMAMTKKGRRQPKIVMQSIALAASCFENLES